jgi:hypothetical protein
MTKLKRVGAFSLLTIMASPAGVFIMNLNTEVAEAHKNLAVHEERFKSIHKMERLLLGELNIIKTDIKLLLKRKDK